ncbi:hypothetical protein TRVA0_027S01728 [Trichomonascus vanleenenianus]|uniref:uncharacterized protein n=1 Tax=Trichomonascus vanleenenianus TaxID=2268995 RepID=UPI003EC9D9CD
MVLHNSKWDKKATRRYYKKHGIDPRAEKEEEEEVPPKEELRSNLWRYQDAEDPEVEEQRFANKVISGEENGVIGEEMDHTLAQAGVRVVDDRDAKEVKFFPDVDVDEEEEKDWKAVVRGTRGQTVDISQYEKAKAKKQQVHDNPDQFDQIQAAIDHNKFVKNVKQRFGGAVNGGTFGKGGENEQDIDDFLNDLENGDGIEESNYNQASKAPGKSHTIDTKSQQFLDSLIG